jgi:hypothetical protein
MADEGLFPREANRQQDGNHSQNTKKVKLAHSTHSRPATFCSNCGLDYEYHPSGVQMKSNTEPSVCEVVTSPVTQFPVVDLIRIFSEPSPTYSYEARSTSQGQGGPYPGPKNLWHTAKDLVIVADPVLTLAIRSVVMRLKLKTIGTINDQSSIPSWRLFPLIEFGANAVEVDNHTAPYALLSILTKVLIGVLVRGGLNVADQDVVNDRRRKIKNRLLTPSHILRSLCGRPQSGLHQSLLLCFARAGVPLTPLDQLETAGANNDKNAE